MRGAGGMGALVRVGGKRSSGAKALLQFLGFLMYGLKPVPFTVLPVGKWPGVHTAGAEAH